MKSDASKSTSASAGSARLLALLLAINLFNYIDRYMLAATELVISKEFFADPNEGQKWMGWLMTAFLLSYMVAAPIFGWLADRMSRWIIVGVGVIVWSLASGATGLAQTFWMMLAMRVLVGVGEAAYGPAAPTLIADMYPVERRGRMLAWFYMAIPVGSAIGYAWGGLVTKHVDWRWAFYSSLPPGILLGAICLLLRDRHRSQGQAEVRKSKASDYLVLLRTPSYVFNTLGMSAMTFALGGIAFWMPRYVHEFRGEPDLAQVNTIFGGITVVSGILATLAGGIVGDRLRTRWSGSYFIVSGVGMLIGWPLFLLALVVPFPGAWVLIFLSEFCLFFNTGPTNTIIANVTHPAIRASAYAINIFVIHLLGDAISPPMIGVVNSFAGGNMNVGFVVTSLAILASGVFWLLGARHLAADTALAPTRILDSSAPV